MVGKKVDIGQLQRGVMGMAFDPIDLFTSIEVADQAGFDMVELGTDMIDSFLKQGHSVDDLQEKLRTSKVKVNLMGTITDIDLPDGVQRQEMLAQHKQMCAVAQAIGCPAIQVASGSSWTRAPWPTACGKVGTGLAETADIAQACGVKLALQPLSWTPVSNLERAVEVMRQANRPNVRLMADTFMIFSGKDTLDMLRGLTVQEIYTVRLADAAPAQLDVWSDDDRCAMPGDGIIPLRPILQAILETGYDGVITYGVSSKHYRCWSRLRIADTLKQKGDAVLEAIAR